MIILSGVLVVLAIALLVTGIVTGNTGHEILGLDGLKLIYVSIGVSIVSALFLAVGVFLRRKELFGATAPATAKASGRTTARPVKAKARVGAGEDAAIVPVTSASATDVPDETTVYVVPGRKRYHLETCRQLAGREKEELTFVEAREEGFTPCTACLPDTALAARAALTDSVEERAADTVGTVADTRPQSPPLEPVDVTRTDIPVTRALPASEQPPAEERDGLTAGRATTDETEATRSPETDARDTESTTTPPADAERTTADAPEEPLAERSRRRGRSLFEPLDRTETTADTAAADPTEEAAAETDGTGSPDVAHRDAEPTLAGATDESETAEPQDDVHDGTDEAADVAAVTREVPRPGATERETPEPAAADRETAAPEATDADRTDADARDAETANADQADAETIDAKTADAETADTQTTDAEKDDTATAGPGAEADAPEAALEPEEPADEEPAGRAAADEAATADATPAEAAERAETATEHDESADDAGTENTDKADKADEVDEIGKAGETDEAEESAEAADAEDTAKAEPADGSDDADDADGPTVRILSGTKRYHRSDCALIEDIADDADDLESLSREEARERGCTPCLVCQPDD
ncbi:prolipoprotein diacylglyceryl transferase [Actinoallomurus rhizosphaericola]|uniref:hypothetical protein n=1 Tax=Actinoallomurus rhizosphaericola TaxID=2952536 RepID=UPI0020931BD4|nr:hypothetical protein [Actinoallomurus rhizosphaericola]MCO5996660.1 hypothetical protein [Actinoallomurus rhizosphaericola]